MPEIEASELGALLNSKEAAAVVDAILGSIPSGAIIACARDGKILRISDYAAQLFGRARSEMEGAMLAQWNVSLPAYDASGRLLPENERPMAKALLGRTVTGFEGLIEAANGELVPCVNNAAPIHNPQGQMIGAISSITDLRPQKALERSLRAALVQRDEAIAQREALYRELTHRMKNHLQIMMALVAQDAQAPARSAEDLADKIKGQLQALAAAYKGMDRAESGERIEALTFVEEVCRPYESAEVRIEAKVDPDDLTLASVQAGPVGMLLNEAVCNSRKHACRSHRCQIDVSLRRLQPGRVRLEIGDDGDGWEPVDPNVTHHGLDLMRLFAGQLHAKLELGIHSLGGALVAVELAEIFS